ncbi:MAG TPA: L,D-transpeptidase [Candidatus Dormibacteraeota bacterium]
MAATQPTRTQSFRLGHALAIVSIALALALGALVVGTVASLDAVTIFSRTTSGDLAPSPQPVGSPLAPSPPVAPTTPTPAATATATPTANSRTTGKLIVVSIAEQRLTAFEDGRTVLTTVVATGRPELPTPTGTFQIMSKAAPYKFVSPWPRGDQYWYPTEWVSYAMLFADDGYFLHDAPWRKVYGPGANVSNGTHGCVNVPTAAMATLYGWATTGTAVIVE